MASSGPRFPTAAASDDALVGLIWTSASKVTVDDDDPANLVLTNVSPLSQFLKVTGFGFQIPPDSVIDGIQVEVKREATQTTSGVTDARARLVRAGEVQTPDKSAAGAWSTSYEYASYGGATDLWGAAWVPEEINDAAFGFAFAAQTAALAETAEVDAIRITIFYHLGPRKLQRRSLLGVGI